MTESMLAIMPAPARLAIMPLLDADWTPMPMLGQPLADEFDQAMAEWAARSDAAKADAARAERTLNERRHAHLDAFQNRHIIEPRPGTATPFTAPGRPHPAAGALEPLPALDADTESHMRAFERIHATQKRRRKARHAA